MKIIWWRKVRSGFIFRIFASFRELENQSEIVICLRVYWEQIVSWVIKCEIYVLSVMDENNGKQITGNKWTLIWNTFWNLPLFRYSHKRVLFKKMQNMIFTFFFSKKFCKLHLFDLRILRIWRKFLITRKFPLYC